MYVRCSLIVRISSGVVVVIMLVLDKLVSIGVVVQIIVLPVLVLVLPVLVVVIHVSVGVVEILVVLQVLVVQILVVGVVEILVVLPVLDVQILVVGEVGVIIITAMLAYPREVTTSTACFIRRVNMTFLIAFTVPTHAMGVAQVASVHERSLEKLPAISTQVMSNLLIFRRFIFQVIITILGWERVGCSKGDHKLQEVSSASDDKKIKTGTTR